MKATNTLLLLYLSLIGGSVLIAGMSSNSTKYYRESYYYQEKNEQNNPDGNFINEAVSGGKMEVEMGRMAKDKAQNQRVKAFADMMVRDHTQANKELENILKEKNYTTASMEHSSHNAPDENPVSSLENQKGRDFDKAYMKMMVKDHDKTIDLFVKESNNGKDSRLKDFATRMLPALRTHLDSAKAIHSDLDKSTMY